MRRNGHHTTSGVNFDLKFDSPCQISYIARHFRNWTTISCILANCLLRLLRDDQNFTSTSGQIFNPKFEIPMGCFLFEYEIWWRYRQDLYVL